MGPFLKLFDGLKKNNTRVNDIGIAVYNVDDMSFLIQQKDSLKKEVEYIKSRRNYLLDNLRDMQNACP